jgi:hypothetical protein
MKPKCNAVITRECMLSCSKINQVPAIVMTLLTGGGKGEWFKANVDFFRDGAHLGLHSPRATNNRDARSNVSASL